MHATEWKDSGRGIADRALKVLRALILAAAALPLSAWAAPSATELIGKSIIALRTTCYEARMRFISYEDSSAAKAAGGNQREVRIYHVAPDLYHVEPISGGSESIGSYYVENAQELVLLHNGVPVFMPERQFAVNDAMATKFLRDLAKSSTTTVLNGQVGDTQVYALRQDASPTIPYTITVGIDKVTWYPLYMMVNDAKGRTRVYYEMLAIDYKRPDELPDGLFVVPEPTSPRQDMPRSPKRSASSAKHLLPLYPAYLPRHYTLEAIRLIDCPVLSAQGTLSAAGGAAGASAGEVAPDIVFQLEVYGPEPGEVISIFQSRGKSSALGLDHLKKGRNRGFVVGQDGDWMITIFGQLGNRELERILSGLEPNDAVIEQLLNETNRLDEIVSEAFPEGN